MKSAATVAPCIECHKSMIADDALVASISLGDPGVWMAPGYRDAMHGTCIVCHQQQVQDKPDAYAAQFSRCDNCHNTEYDDEIHRTGPYASNPESGGGR
jgi:hypothetical protein